MHWTRKKSAENKMQPKTKHWRKQQNFQTRMQQANWTEAWIGGTLNEFVPQNSKQETINNQEIISTSNKKTEQDSEVFA
jgi:hypothetical protein